MTISRQISLIVAMTANKAIGKNNDLLFHLPGDLKRFKAITSGHTLIMGRNTLLSLPKWPLPNRRHLVLTTDPNARFAGCETVLSVEEALQKITGEEEVFVIGGGSVYRQFYPVAGKLYLTLVHQEFEADTFFPDMDFSDWKQLSREDYYDEKNNFKYSYIDLIRKA